MRKEVNGLPVIPDAMLRFGTVWMQA